MAELRKVLLVEDDQDIQSVALMALETVGGLEVSVASNGQEALDCIGNIAPDLVLLDVMMPGMDGPTTLKHLKENSETRNIPVIFLTASVQPQELDTYRSSGILGVLAKPFDPMTLADDVRNLFQSSSDTP